MRAVSSAGGSDEAIRNSAPGLQRNLYVGAGRLGRVALDEENTRRDGEQYREQASTHATFSDV
jgi:hypothetical protein